MQGTQKKGFGDHVVKALPFILAILTVFVVWRSWSGSDLSVSGPSISKPGTELMAEYTKAAAQHDAEVKQGQKTPKQVALSYRTRHMFVLEQIVAENYPKSFHDFEEIQVESKNGTVVKFWASKRGFCLGKSDDCVEISLDGPHSAAAAQLMGYALPSYWHVSHILRKAQKEGGVVKFYTYCEVIHSLGEEKCNPNRVDISKGMSPQFIRQRNELLQKWMKEHKISDNQLIAGYFKTIIQPSGLRRRTSKNPRDHVTYVRPPREGSGHQVAWITYGGQDHLGKFNPPMPGSYYFQGLRMVKLEMEVNGKAITMAEFFNSEKYAREFVFYSHTIKDKGAVAYPLDPELEKYVEQNK